MKKLLSALPFIVLLIACSAKPVVHERIDNIVRVLMNDPGRHYTLLVQVAETNRFIERELWVSSPSDNVLAVVYENDVPDGQKMWAEITYWTEGSYTLVVHVRGESDVEGGGWNHGKAGQGTTQVIR